MRGFAITLFPENISSEPTPEQINENSIIIPVLAEDEEEALKKALIAKPGHLLIGLISLEMLNSYKNIILDFAKEANISLSE